MTISELKEYIYKENKIEYILQEIGCKHIVYHPNKCYYSCSNYNGDNQNAVNVRNNTYLGVTNYTRTKEFDDNSDLITLVQYNKQLSFIEALKYLHKILDLPFEFKKSVEKPKKKVNPLDVFTKHLRCNKRVVNVDDIKVLEDSLMNDYVPMLHIDFFKDGIMPWTRKKFGLAYSYRHKRVIIPHKYWMTGQLLGMNMRTTVENYDTFGINKYYLTSGFNKSLNIYGLYENYETIRKARYVVVAESERSCLKRHSLCDGTVVSLSGKTISDEQVRILIGLNVEIVIGLDADVNINEVRHMCEKFYRTRPVSYIWDSYSILKSKQAPMDARNKDYQFLLENRIKYSDIEHREYLKSLGKR